MKPIDALALGCIRTLAPALALLLQPALSHAQVQPASAATTPAAPTVREGLRIDDRRRDDPFTIDLWDQPVMLTGSWEYTDERRGNFDLRRAQARDRRVREHELKLEARTRAAEDTEVFLQVVGLHETRRTEGTPAKEVNKSLERGQTWVRFDRLGGTPWALQLGRVALIDRRAWWWDDDLDAVRALYSGSDFRLDTGLARELGGVSSAFNGALPGDRGVTRWFGQATWRLARRHALDLFWLWQRDRSGRPPAGRVFAGENELDPVDFSGRWVGLRASGEFRGEDRDSSLRLAYWADAAMVRGREHRTGFGEGADGRPIAEATGQRRVRGQALDLGATLIAPVALRPSLTLGYARGSGGAPSATEDRHFRQTGLQENKARLGGVKRLRMYGELLNPELSNLAVSTVGVGLRYMSNSSLELVAHGYRQLTPSTSLVGARLSADPTGLSGDIGREVDLVLALREWRQFELTLRWSRFMPGRAFDPEHRDPAHALEFGAAFNF